MAALSHQICPSTLPLLHSSSQNPILSKPQLSVCSKLSRPSFSLFAAQPNSSSQSSPSIFLPLLENARIDQREQEIEKQEEEDENLTDPIIRFFKSRTSTQDPTHEGKFSLQKNRRTLWRLSTDFQSDAEPDIEDVFTKNENRHIGSASSDSIPLPEGIVREIIQVARDLPENSTLGEQLSAFEGRISATECLEVLGLMGDEGMMTCCLYFFEWMRLQEPSLVTPRACTVLFPILGRAGMGDKLMILFRNLPQNKEFGDVHVYNAAISGLLCCERYDDACKVYETMEANGISPDHVTCSIMITVMRKMARSAKEAWEFFERMNRKGVKWSPEVLGALIKSFCDEGLKNEALIIQVEMARKGISSNVIVYNTLMDAFNKSNQIEEVEGLFTEMKGKGLKPTSATFNILMDAYSRRMQPEIVEKLLLEMQDAGLQPDARSYTCLISAYGRQKKMSDMAADAFLKMKKVGIKPTSHSYTALIHAYSVSGWHEKAYIAFEHMQREGVKPSVETYTALLDAFRRAGDAQMLMKIWKLMIREKVEGTRVTFNILLDGFAKQGHYVEARDVISEFGKFGLQPTVITYNMLMNAYGRGGQHSKLPQLLKEMAALDLKPDSVTYLTMIYAFIRVRDFRRAFFYHKKMVKSGQVPDAKSYQKLRALLEVKAKVKNRRDRSAILGIINSRMGLLKVKKKGKKDEFWKHKKRDPRMIPRMHNADHESR
ncbi:hypothetical protein P3X46_023467 [Hevea brasiliensis]|uniref:Pentacotripeptide-repeat region of PRORP domain-containing protein n=1 Tax=Hevea brasiliensis TaxID=3981 RepID=A0ABQ9LCW4_HEVBR|nr:pentatricopeptide repeat-containing protein At5g50280, chloroplastic [Hevea brasiliensis]KAJ9163839.1 hypothetical protein P3X46_023467 [Hevea brasiliensis]